MTAGEIRTLTYKVKLKAGYTGIVPSNKNLTNKAVIYAKTYPKMRIQQSSRRAQGQR